MAKCSFCGKKMTENEGTLYVLNDGKTRLFCSSKCEKNMNKLGRLPRTTKWVKEQ